MEIETVWQGQYVDLVKRGNWEYAARKNLTGIVGIVAVTDDGRIVLCEQYRAPVDANVIEIPAGIVGDHEGEEGETMEDAARRELLEETGYEAEDFEFMFEGPASPGLTDEIITFLRAKDPKKVGEGGGAGSENIIVHEVPVKNLEDWLKVQKASGMLIDMKVYSILHFCS